jgi:folate-dependent phosphoribosylglycinamide formyltransferase PurN
VVKKNDEQKVMRIGLLASKNMSKFVLNTLKPVFEDKNMQVALVIIDSRPKLTLKQKIKKNFKRGRGGYMLVMAVQSYFNKKQPAIDTKGFCNEQKIDYFETSNHYASETIDKIQSYNLDVLVLTGGFGIIKSPLLNITPWGVLSYHHGNMRKYRGMPPAFWELYNNENEMGVTVQLLSAGLDCGVPVEEITIPIMLKDTLKSLETRAMQTSEVMLWKALNKLASGTFKPEMIEEFGRVYTLPDLTQWIFFQIKLLWRQLKFN